ncbi:MULTISPECIES: HAMP domain-containing protein [Rhizobium]|uniref:HAMP domain-containing protein n=1 Tax=Rhizobium TaxID=379 RepID=UPI001B31B896|nr:MULTISPECIES: HAMP domain-containing protein [Rhizobium]MBX4908971.1 HAMP domain-containing protein [Rhizobium bangladeshense]MBX5216103.1 HAMP domain-containing protein [Rhizobium sp. NLR9a]MBX5223015.1 HAMP domain-containing protein [Rhizobium sp. NLR8a]MBX5230021.1 HAMP domain-containing protein [Rhizobium sp. NLR9b]MBX5234483.1 HAMP domain-containing protein [Rhizobium sp. NLR4a]
MLPTLVLSLNLDIGRLTIITLIGRIAASMSDLAEGNLDADIPFTDRPDEIGRVAFTGLRSLGARRGNVDGIE